MKAIHLIQKDPKLRPCPVEKGSSTYKSGFWNISIGRAPEFIGADIYFHEQQMEPSFFGGKIVSFEIKENDPWAGRIIFILESLRDHKGVKTSRGGWSMEMKIIE
ncbi:MAG: hypothetical protein WC959_09405 [Kiritimatiellales bacterium]